jgi:hypothetical protein
VTVGAVTVGWAAAVASAGTAEDGIEQT